ncbi:unnamed protein product [Rotaria magnacalcarata]|uniref:G-protein coupled receptors family 1 profile domain-containing protein n=3 Tax=Rotaria magnacalcarata TaxID=392030 RepID=A0A819X2K0_9BILA|nr:unnamed protein product [Rotaria magnacalcarata]
MNHTNFTNPSLIRKTTTNECRFSRFAGSLLLATSIISFIVNLHSLPKNNKIYCLPHRDIDVVVGMFASSLCVITISAPSVVVQFFLRRRLLYMLVALSVVRYATTANSSISSQIQRRMEQYGWHLVTICFVMGGVWAAPPIFDRMSAYAPDALDFHFGLDWFDRSLPGRIYFLFLFFFALFMPIIIVIYVNVYIQHTIYHLTYLRPSIVLELQQIPKARRSHEDQRFVLATGINVFVYIIAWTPYSIVALAQVFGDQFPLYNPWLTKIGAVLVKLSMITNPIVYGIILKGHTRMKLR